MRHLSVTETAMQDQTKASNRATFVERNTNPMPEWEQAGDGFEIDPNGIAGLRFAYAEWLPVHRINYGGIKNGPNRFRL